MSISAARRNFYKVPRIPEMTRRIGQPISTSFVVVRLYSDIFEFLRPFRTNRELAISFCLFPSFVNCRSLLPLFYFSRLVLRVAAIVSFAYAHVYKSVCMATFSDFE